MTQQLAVLLREPDLPQHFWNGSDTNSMPFFWTYASATIICTIAETGEIHLINAENEA